MQEEDPADVSDIGEDWTNVVKAVTSLLHNRFPNIRRAVHRLTGDVTEAAFDALVARLQRYRTHQQLVTVNQIVATSGFPAPVVARAIAEQQRIDELLASALARVANQGRDVDPPRSASKESTIDDDWFDVFRREATDRSHADLREAFVRILAGEIQGPGTFSMRTLRVLGMLDRGTAALFRKAVSVSVRLELPIGERRTGLIRDARIPDLGRSLNQNGLAEHGFDYRVLTALTEAELLHSEYSSSADYGPARMVSATGEVVAPDPRSPNVQFPMGHQGRFWLLVPTAASRQGQPVGVRGRHVHKSRQGTLVDRRHRSDAVVYGANADTLHELGLLDDPLRWSLNAIDGWLASVLG